MNAVIYARYSSHSQTEQSIEGQLRDNYAFAMREGYTVVKEYIDRAQSGTTDNRTSFKRMIDDSAKKQFEVIIVWKLDRFARNRYDSAIYKAKLKKNNVRVVSCMENIADNPEGIILEGMLEAMAEYYSANLSVNVKRGQRETLAKGNFCGGSIPFGYKVQNGKLVPDEKTAPIAKYVFEQYAIGVPKKEIFDELTRLGVKSPTGRPLSKSSFQHMLKNRTYCGEYMIHGEIIEGCATPIVTKELFEKVQNRLSTVARTPAANKAKVEYLLQGKAFCGHCGSKMVGESGRGKLGNVYHYYACSVKKKDHACDKKNEKKEELENSIIEKTVDYVLNPDNMRKIAKGVVEAFNRETRKSNMEEIEKALSKCEADLNNLVDALAEAPKATHKRIYAKIEALEARKEELEKDLAKERIAQDVRLTEQSVMRWMSQFCQGDLNDEAYRRRIIGTFINSVYVYDDHLEIFYNVRDNQAPINPSAQNFSSQDSTSPDSTFPDSTPEAFFPDAFPIYPKSSDMDAPLTPDRSKSELSFIFVNAAFGCVFQRG